MGQLWDMLDENLNKNYKDHSSKLFSYLKETFSNYKFDDDDWTQFIVDEINQNLEVISSTEKLYDFIGEHLIDILAAEKERKALIAQIFTYLKKNNMLHSDFNASSSEEEKEDDNIDLTAIKDTIDDDEDSYIEGCCLMCERKMLLTKHHVIPKEVHEWYRKHHGMTKDQLHQGIMICRSCHSALHSFEDNKTLAEKYSTIEAILEHPKVQKWLPYIRKKRPISKTDRRTLPPNGPRNLPPKYEEYDT